MSQPLWTPTDDLIEGAHISIFRTFANTKTGLKLANSDDLHRFSVEDRETFWSLVRDFTGIKASAWGERVLVDGDKMPGAKWFPDARLNYAENLLRRRDDADALVFYSENGTNRRLSFQQLYDGTSQLVQALKSKGVGAGDRVCGYLPNMPETVMAMLATTAIGATWSSTSPDFGERGVLDRFGQIEPKVLFITDGYHYNGKRHDMTAKNAAVINALPSLTSAICLPYDGLDADIDTSPLPKTEAVTDCMSAFPAGDIDFAQVPFDHPLYIMFSSGTTGAPKCMVHSVGGTILKHAAEQSIQCDIRTNDRVFFFTTCGWMMWNWLVSALACEASVLLYDGSPFHPSPDVLFDFAEKERMTFFGTSAKFIDALSKAGARPKDNHDLANLRTLVSTGSPLAPESFDYAYDAIIDQTQLVSFSGGTDIMGCFCGGDPTKPVWRGEIQQVMLGMDVQCWDDDGTPLRGESLKGKKGELVCAKAFPSMPTGFWGDPDGSRYKAAYFEQFPNVWTHGDYIEMTANGGIIIHGRSDATLNPGGVRIGTAEIYRQVEQLEEVQESIVIGQEWDNDVRVVLFVVLANDLALDDDLIGKIQAHVRKTCTPRHVPARVVQVADIPRTKSGKITELAVRDIVHGRPVKNKEALANADALDHFKDRPELAT